jgi:Xaa-Pro aminopeptidase
MLMELDNGSTTIFQPEQSERIRRVYGPNLLSLPPAEQEKLVAHVTLKPLGDLDLELAVKLGQEADLWVRQGFPDRADGARVEVGRDYAAQYALSYGESQPGDRAILAKLAVRYPAARQRDLTSAIDAMRNIKTPQEIEMLRRNGKISAEGIRRAIARAKPGIYQYQVEAEAAYWFRHEGAQGWAYPAIVGSGQNINTIHYFADRNQIQANELVVFDFAADLEQMTMDITRTFNVSGKFTPEQAKWYQVDLEAQKACIALLSPGHTYEEAAAAGKAVFEKAGIGDLWRGWPGHFVGMATHDVLRPSGPVKAGQVLTIEPYIDLPDKHMHYRVEDTVLITETGHEILSAGVPKEMADVEKLVGSEVGKP